MKNVFVYVCFIFVLISHKASAYDKVEDKSFCEIKMNLENQLNEYFNRHLGMEDFSPELLDDITDQLVKNLNDEKYSFAEKVGFARTLKKLNPDYYNRHIKNNGK